MRSEKERIPCGAYTKVVVDLATNVADVVLVNNRLPGKSRILLLLSVPAPFLYALGIGLIVI